MSQSTSPFPQYGTNASPAAPSDWVALTRRLWEGRRVIILAMLVGAALGVALALLSEPRYAATTTLMPQSSTANASQLSGLASLAGINLDLSQSNELSPVVYPRIANSLRFKLELMHSKFTFADYAQPVSLYEYFTGGKAEAEGGARAEGKPAAEGGARAEGKPADDVVAVGAVTDGVPAAEKAGVPDTLLSLTPQEVIVKKLLDKNIFLSLDKKEGLLTLKVTMPEPLVAAQVVQKVQEMLQRDIIRMKTEKAQADLDFIQERYDAVKAEAEGYQAAMSVGSDRFKDLVSSVPKLTNTRLQTRYSISNSVFQELAKQLEQAKIQVKKDTPVFTVLEPVTVPYEEEGRGRVFIVVLFVVLGAIIGIAVLMVKHALASVAQRWKYADRS